MTLRSRRLVLILLAALFLAPLEAGVGAAAAAAPSGGSQTKIQKTSKAGTRKGGRRRRARRLPPGGVVWARNAVVLDPATNEILFEKNASASVPIASLSKLMTAIVFLEQNPDLDRIVEVAREDLAGAGRSQLRSRERVALRDLLHMSLMCSDNAATRVLTRESGLSREDFLAGMNRRGVELGLERTRFVEFTGLDERNVSTATDCARLLRAAAGVPMIQEIMTRRSHAFTSEYRTWRRSHQVGNTNRMLYGHYEVRGGKTGFILEAGYCFATWIHTQQRDLIAVVLGAPTAATRFADVTRMVQRTTQTSATAPPQP